MVLDAAIVAMACSLAPNTLALRPDGESAAADAGMEGTVAPLSTCNTRNGEMADVPPKSCHLRHATHQCTCCRHVVT